MSVKNIPVFVSGNLWRVKKDDLTYYGVFDLDNRTFNLLNSRFCNSNRRFLDIEKYHSCVRPPTMYYAGKLLCQRCFNTYYEKSHNMLKSKLAVVIDSLSHNNVLLQRYFPNEEMTRDFVEFCHKYNIGENGFSFFALDLVDVLETVE